MERNIEKTVEIKGNNSSVYYCSHCTDLLKVDDYNFSDGQCLKCRQKGYGGRSGLYIDTEGNNKIDAILQSKGRKN